MKPGSIIDERSQHLRPALQAVYANVVAQPIPSDMMDLLRAMDDVPQKRGFSGWNRGQRCNRTKGD
ncbi:hypothetical protein [Novosphingobium sp. M1R2S20]|uniref:Anti-sigma factor NepR domain-containing protein n=1 Tax=Novosphingobium rhizovicinum TaxID=3228928 RepID=A0ABV3RDR1_9SPHN